MSTVEIQVPDIGDFKDVPVIEIHVEPGDVVAVDDPLVTLESDKATMDVPAPPAGTVSELRIERRRHGVAGKRAPGPRGGGSCWHAAQGARPGKRAS